MYGARFEIHCRPEANTKMRTWRAEPNQSATLTQCSVSAPLGDEADCIAQQSTASDPPTGPILSGGIDCCCGRRCLHGKHFCSQRVLAHLINDELAPKYRATWRDKSKAPLGKYPVWKLHTQKLRNYLQRTVAV